MLEGSEDKFYADVIWCYIVTKEDKEEVRGRCRALQFKLTKLISLIQFESLLVSILVHFLLGNSHTY